MQNQNFHKFVFFPAASTALGATWPRPLQTGRFLFHLPPIRQVGSNGLDGGGGDGDGGGDDDGGGDGDGDCDDGGQGG